MTVRAKTVGGDNSVHSLFWRESRRLITHLCFFFSLFILLVWLALLYHFQKQSARTLAEAMQNQVKYWVEVGDTFQLTRALSGLIERGAFVGVVVFDATGQKRFVRPENLESPPEYPHSTIVTWSGLMPMLWHCELGNENGREKWGGICLASKFSPFNSALIVGFIAIGLAAFLTYWLKRIRTLSMGVVTPLVHLREHIANFPAKKNSVGADFGFSELNEVCAAFNAVYAKLKETEAEKRRTAHVVATAQLAQQVAHDIQSPLAALAVVESEMTKLPEETRILVRTAIGRIHSISKHLLEKSRPSFNATAESENAMAPQLLAAALETIVAEKNTQFRREGIKVELVMGPEGYSLFGRIVITEFKRAISNLINNGAEAGPASGVVSVTLRKLGDEIEISVADDGKGIPKKIMDVLTNRGASYNKPGGSGLGLHHARSCFEQWRGSLEIQSELNLGTRVRLRLPAVTAPKWYATHIEVSAPSAVGVLDDDQSIHWVWDKRFASFQRLGIQLHHLYHPADFRDFVARRKSLAENTLYLVDHELLGSSESGLDLIEQLGIAGQSILVTSLYEDSTIEDRCRRLGVRLMPKRSAGYVTVTQKLTTAVRRNHLKKIGTIVQGERKPG